MPKSYFSLRPDVQEISLKELKHLHTNGRQLHLWEEQKFTETYNVALHCYLSLGRIWECLVTLIQRSLFAP